MLVWNGRELETTDWDRDSCSHNWGEWSGVERINGREGRRLRLCRNCGGSQSEANFQPYTWGERREVPRLVRLGDDEVARPAGVIQ